MDTVEGRHRSHRKLPSNTWPLARRIAVGGGNYCVQQHLVESQSNRRQNIIFLPTHLWWRRGAGAAFESKEPEVNVTGGSRVNQLVGPIADKSKMSPLRVNIIVSSGTHIPRVHSARGFSCRTCWKPQLIAAMDIADRTILDRPHRAELHVIAAVRIDDDWTLTKSENRIWVKELVLARAKRAHSSGRRE